MTYVAIVENNPHNRLLARALLEELYHHDYITKPIVAETLLLSTITRALAGAARR